MIRDGEARYGRHYKHAKAATLYLTVFLERIDEDRSDIFGRLLSLMKKHHMLAFLSALRLHHVQAMMNLRQVFEAGAAAAYCIAHPKVEDFVDIDEFRIMDPSKKALAIKRYKWLEGNYAVPSSWIKEQKDQINKYSGHANIVSGDRTFRVVAAGKGASTPVFDVEDKDLVKVDLWQISSAAIGLMQLIHNVTSDVARTSGRSVLGFRTDFQQKMPDLMAESKALLDEQEGSDRFKAWILRMEQRAEASGKAESTGGPHRHHRGRLRGDRRHAFALWNPH
jgi:hypothetical protein